MLISSRTMISPNCGKIVRVLSNGYEYFSPALDHEDIFNWEWETAKKVARSKETFFELIKRYIPNVGESKALKITKYTILAFLDRVLIDVIENNVVFMLPKEMGYIVCAQRSPESGAKYNLKTRQYSVWVFFVFTKRGYALSRGKKKFLNLSLKYRKMIHRELEKGHIYPGIEEVMIKMQEYVDHSIRKS